MSSQAQIDANRENSLLSTGPLSPEGKTASAQNALTHGFSASYAVIAPEQRQDFDALQLALHSSIQPLGPIEDFLFRRIVHAAWNIEMIDHAEAGLFTGSAEMYLNGENEKVVARLARYRTMHLRQYNQAMRSLRYEQQQRGLRAVAQAYSPQLATSVPPLANFTKISEFAKQSQIRKRFSTLPPELQDNFLAMEIESRHMNAKSRIEREELRNTQAAA